MSIVPIIIPFYKEHEKLRKCEAAIAAQTWAQHEVFVRDNTHDNILFTAAVNEGLARFCCRDDVRYVMVLNQDAYMQKDCVQRLVEFMDAHPDCGIACPLQYQDRGGGVQWGGPGTAAKMSAARVVTWGGSLQAFPVGAHRTDSFASYREPFETYWANGACMMIRVDAIRECGLFDRNMRFICSDADFSFTARARGWKVYVVPAALCEHGLNVSGSAGSLEIQLVKWRDACYFAEKWAATDLYKRLAHEGPALTAIGVRKEIASMRREIAWLERRLGIAPPASPLPSWVTAMTLPPATQRTGRF